MQKGYKRLGWWFTASLAALLFLPQLMHPGMYVDGLLYATISRNLAEGMGTMWSPYFSEVLFPAFYEHPPLAFWLQSIGYLIFGDHWWLDKIYGIVLLAGCLLLIGRIAYRGLGVHWIPAVGFLLLPIIWWSFGNNMLENTVSFFVLLSVWGQYQWLRKQQNYWLIIAGVALLFGFLAKGPVALFPLIWLPLDRYFLERSEMRRAWKGMLWVGGVFLAGFLLLMLYTPSRTGILQYLDQQVWSSLSGKRNDGSRLDIGIRLVENLIPLLLLYVLGVWLNRAPEQRDNLRYSLRWVLFALCGTLPIFISSKINIHYFIPAFPFYALALAPLFRNSMFDYLQDTFHLRRFRYSGWFLVVVLWLFTLILTLNQTGKPKRDLTTLSDLELIAEEAGNGSTIGLTPELYTLWSLHANAQRFHHISLAMDSSTQFVISLKPSLSGHHMLTPANQEFFLHIKAP